MREITPDSLNKLVVKKRPERVSGADIQYVCTVCGHTETEFALTSRNHKHCGRCTQLSVKASLIPTMNWVESDVQAPNSFGE